jgi:hypothetical protein
MSGKRSSRFVSLYLTRHVVYQETWNKYVRSILGSYIATQVKPGIVVYCYYPADARCSPGIWDRLSKSSNFQEPSPVLSTVNSQISILLACMNSVPPASPHIYINCPALSVHIASRISTGTWSLLCQPYSRSHWSTLCREGWTRSSLLWRINKVARD